MYFLPIAARGAVAAAVAIALANVVHLWAILVSATYAGEPFNLRRVATQLVLLSLAPTLAAAAIRRTGRAWYSLEANRLVIRQRRSEVDITFESISGMRLSRLPFPSPALAVRLRSGQTLARRIELPDPASLLEALAPSVPDAKALRSHPQVAFASARAPLSRQRARRIAVKFVLFPAAAALVMFRAYQYIEFGGPFGEYHLYGALAYLRSFAGYLVGTSAVLVLYAAAWRTLAETCTAIATALSPQRARAWRRIAEGISAVAYYAGIPLLLASRFLA